MAETTCGQESGRQDSGRRPAQGRDYGQRRSAARRSGRREARTENVRPANDCARLQRAVETEVIPRLMLALRSARPTDGADYTSRMRTITHAEVTELVAHLLDGSKGAAQSLVDRWIVAGATKDTLLLELLAPSAKRLGEYWADDLCTFVDVTIAMGGLQTLVRQVLASIPDRADLGVRTILLLPVSGEQHTFALQILDAFFSRSGWVVDRAPKFEGQDVRANLRRLEPDIVGITISSEHLLEQLASDIGFLRRATGEHFINIIVGGPVFIGRPDRVTLVGADGTAEDAPGAVALAEQLVTERLAR